MHCSAIAAITDSEGTDRRVTVEAIEPTIEPKLQQTHWHSLSLPFSAQLLSRSTRLLSLSLSYSLSWAELSWTTAVGVDGENGVESSAVAYDSERSIATVNVCDVVLHSFIAVKSQFVLKSFIFGLFPSSASDWSLLPALSSDRSHGRHCEPLALNFLLVLFALDQSDRGLRGFPSVLWFRFWFGLDSQLSTHCAAIEHYSASARVLE